MLSHASGHARTVLLECNLQSTQSDVSDFLYGLLGLLRRLYVSLMHSSEDRPGIPFTLRITVIEVGTCNPIPKAAVDIWHCDAGGIYSHFVNASLSSGSGGPSPGMNGTRPPPGSAAPPPQGGSQNNDNSTFLRGM